MDRCTSRATESGRLGADGPILPSRREALDRLLPALPRGPVLITGEPGAGKTWLAGKLAEEAGAGIAWVEVDVSPSTVPDDLFAAIASGLGLAPRADRPAIVAALLESSRDGRSWGLRVDESQNASPAILEEVRILDNRLGRPDGFAAIVLVAQTSLVGRLGLRAFAGLESRLSAHAHLAPIDADEAEEMLGDAAIDAGVIESIFRSSMGNPARLLRLALASATAEGSLDARPQRRLDSDRGPLLPSRPPLRIEDGLIEVGWDPEAEPGVSGDAGPVSVRGLAEQRDDAAFRVRDEAEAAGESDMSPEEAEIDEEPEDEGVDLGPSPSIRAEGEHEFAPYSQLFARRNRAGETA